ncbi:MAG: dihydrolipoyl dehydrogenase [Myxococcota bacterium]
MNIKKVDVAIVGAGSAGLSARREVELRGRDYVLIERGPFGTTCARVGCMPSKLLIAAADAAHEVHQAGMFGVRVPEGVTVDGRAVMDRVRRERDRFVGFVLESTDKLEEGKVLRGQAKFLDNTTLQVDDHTRVEAKTVILGTGSSPWIPDALNDVQDRVMVNDDVFDLEDLPKSIVVFGTGIIGVELGQALHRLGVRVDFVNPFDAVGPLSDPKVKAKAEEVFGNELRLHLGVSQLRVEPAGDGVRVWFEDRHGEPFEATYERALAAAGRRPNLSQLNLEAAGISLGEHGRPVGWNPRTTQIGDSRVFMAGDMTGHRPLLHEAADEGRIAGANAAMWPEVRAHIRRTPLAVMFSDPQIATVGTPFRQLHEDDIVIGEVSYDDQGRARVMGKNKGLVRIYARKEDGALVGAEMFGPRVEHTAHLLAWAISERMTVERALRMPFYHPVIEEGIRTALRSASYQMNLIPKPCAHDLDCGPGA